MKNSIKKPLKASNGITLIALVVTIIVLLILARYQYYDAVTEKIGILTKAGQAKTLTDESQIREEIQLAWNGVQVDGVTKGWDNSTKAGALNTELLKEDGNASATWNTTNSIIDITYKGYETTINPNTGTMTALAKAGETPVTPPTSNAIDYGEKDEETVVVGDNITIGTEKFKVIRKSADGKTITALPFFNLDINSTPIKQYTKETLTSYTDHSQYNSWVKFSNLDTATWGESENINLNTHVNNLKSYIDAYKSTLGINNITVTIGNYFETESGADYMGDLSDSLLQPCMEDSDEYWDGGYYDYLPYWLSSSEWVDESGSGIHFVNQYGGFDEDGTKNGLEYGMGVRPILIISLSD